MLITELDSFYIDNVNNLMYKSATPEELYKKLDEFFINEFDTYFYSVLLLDDNDNNFYVEHSCMPGLQRLKNKLLPLFENKILRRLYGFGTLKDFIPGENSYISIGGEYVELNNAMTIEYNSRLIGFFLLHDKGLYETEYSEKFKYLLKQLANAIVIFKRLEAERYLNFTYLSNLKIMKFLNSLLKENSIEAIFYRILNDIYELTEAEAGCVALFNEEEWITPAELGMNINILHALKFRDGMNLLEFAQQVQQIYNIEAPQISEQLDLSQLKVNIKSILIAPIIINGECNNFVVIVNYHKFLDENTILYIQKITEIAATAIQNYDISNDADLSFPEKEAKLNNLRDKFIITLETLLDQIEIN
ncbi:MAG TPA: GAF domain-containing protein [bacterium]|nr:GAF domain-containing protein [bacterium]